MPRGENPKSRANLIPQNKRTKKEQRKVAQMGGAASGESRRRLKTLRELDDEYTTDDMRLKMLGGLVARAQRNSNDLKLYCELMGIDNPLQTEETGARIIFCGEDEIHE